MMNTRAIFIGEDGSMGLRYDEEYSITITKQPDGMYEVMWVDNGNLGTCLYGSVDKINENWEIV